MFKRVAMTDRGEEAKQTYVELTEYAATRTRELSQLFRPYIKATDQYGKLICRITLVLGQGYSMLII